MGPIFVILLAVLATAIVNRLIGSGPMANSGMRYGCAIAGAFLLAWLVGSALQQASFMAAPPGPLTLLAALIGGFLGAFVGSAVARRHVD